MNILIIGSGGREHALAWKIKQSPLCSSLYVLPGNAGSRALAEGLDIPLSDFYQVGQWVIDHVIDLVVVGPEAPLVEGIRDYFESNEQLKKIPFIGPGRKGAELEGSKDFSKKFMERHGIPTAKAKTFTAADMHEASTYLRTCKPPIVLKADGLAAGKGVVICLSRSEANQALQQMLIEKKFGDAGSKVLIEEFLSGIELSVFVLTDGQDYVLLPEAKDYKRIGVGDVGLNTGGMGAVSPVPFANERFLEKVRHRIIDPTIRGLQHEKIPYKGFLFIGLMNVGGEPFVIEYNVRLGDPETQAILPRVENDLVELLVACGKGELKGQQVRVSPLHAVTAVMVAGGYPESYEKNKVITGIDQVSNALVFHAGTIMHKQQLVTNGGRVLALTATGASFDEARSKAYGAASKIHWDGLYYRSDIGEDLTKLH